jgi:predicted phosphodiesterase/DNA-binding transcriptional regulator YhcF (GntR family)
MDYTEINDFILTNKHLSYGELATLLSITPEAVRKRYKRLRAKYGLPAKGVVNAIVTEDKPIDPKDLIQQRKLVMLEKQIKTAESAEIETAARHALLVDALSEAVVPLTFKPAPVRYKEPEKAHKEAVALVLSDLHFGKKTKHYNIETAKERFNAIIDNFIQIVSLHRQAYPIDELHIFMTGDIVDGASIYPTHPHHVDNHVVNQIFKSLETVVARFAELANLFEKVYVHTVRGNHGRLSKFEHENANFDYLYSLTLEMACKNIPNMTFNTPESWQQVIDVKGTKILQYHGHQIKMTLNLPWYGITTRISRWASTQSIGYFDVAIQGHFHCSSCLRWNDKKIFTNGTLVIGDEFAVEFLGLESSEAQWCFGVHPERKVTWQYELQPE